MAAENATQLVSTVILLGAAVVAVPLFKRIGLGSVLGYLAAGLAIGPFGLGLFNDPQAIIHVAELGVVMFLFIIGLEMKPSHLWTLRRQIFGLGSMQVVLAAAALTLVGILFGFSWQVSFVSASGFVLTSTAIVMQVLGERNELSSKSGQQIVSILLFEDLLIVPLLAVVAFLAPPSAVEAAAKPLWQSIGIALSAVAVLVAAGRWLLNPLFQLLAKSKAREVMTAAALLVVLGAALLMEESGLSMAMGAFIAGVLLSESAFRHQLEADIEPFRGLLLGLFFLGVGMSLDLQVVAQNWVLIVSGVLALMAAKAAVIYGVARLAKSSRRQAAERAVLMAQGGEFAFVLFAAAASQGVIDAVVHANMTAVVVLSMVLTPLCLIAYGKWLEPRLQTVSDGLQDDEIDEQNPVIIIGMGRFGQIVSDVLRMSGHELTIIDRDPTTVAGMNQYRNKTYFGDASRPELLLAAGLEKARLLVVAIDNQPQTLQIIEFAKQTNPDIHIIARSYDRLHTFQVYQAGADEIIRETFDSAVRTGRRALEALGMPAGKAEEVSDVYFHFDRQSVSEMSKAYAPNIARFQNKEMLQIAKAEDRKTQQAIQAALRGEVVEKPEY
ncbi:monovalent cation:proton antiporter-2 (CPA2) family protein [Uruburuella testudinis]|uniref:Monovalent cation:proton antiporter-2 (CPA2) family protein n=1 Tax=Uruburuella testudinis TaxID=1282863 RepID=A0ABY4DTK5_9NEIS|nr:monovalent cation:proton antiporter-2 (CPA2) family protein [Uruburuella testudinis]UOO81354.1 monovalent cation:proton antiporter-2 (CPA2) family protein [Uruburuella testudinis]